MTPAPDCLVEVGAILCGADASGGFTTIPDAAIHVVGGNIAEIGPTAGLHARFPDLPHYGGRGMIAMPGMVNGHHHSGITPLMHGVPFAPLEFWLPRFRAQRRVPLRLDTLYSAIEMLESGTTTVHHIHGGVSGAPDMWRATADGVLDAYGEIGMRAGFSFMIRDRNRLTYEDDGTLLAALPADAAEWLGAQLAAEAVPVPELETGPWNERASATQILRMATEHGAMTAGCGDRIGRPEVGRAADIVLLDRARVERPAVDPRTPLVDVVLMRAKSQAVDQVFVGGRQVVANGRVTGIDRDAVMAEIAAEMRRPLTEAEAQAAAMIDQIVPVAMDQHRRLVADTWRPYRYNGMAD